MRPLTPGILQEFVVAVRGRFTGLSVSVEPSGILQEFVVAVRGCRFRIAPPAGTEGPQSASPDPG
jgi:hypothetical protein